MTQLSIMGSICPTSNAYQVMGLSSHSTQAQSAISNKAPPHPLGEPCREAGNQGVHQVEVGPWAPLAQPSSLEAPLVPTSLVQVPRPDPQAVPVEGLEFQSPLEEQVIQLPWPNPLSVCIWFTPRIGTKGGHPSSSTKFNLYSHAESA